MHSRPVTAIYRSLTHRDCYPQSITVSTSRFLVTDFNTGTTTFSLNYTLFSSKPDFHTKYSCNQLVAQTVPVITTQQGPRTKRSSSTVVKTCLPRRCVAPVAARNTKPPFPKRSPLLHVDSLPLEPVSLRSLPSNSIINSIGRRNSE
jgi:hypothetical protein